MRLSLRARFALATGLLVGAAAISVAIASYVSLARSLHDQATSAAAEQARQLAGLVDRSTATEASAANGGGAGERGGNFVGLRDPSLAGQFVRPGLWVEVLGPNGSIVQRSPRAPRGLAGAAIRGRCRNSGAASAELSRPSAALACQRIGTRRVPLGFIVAARSLADVASTLATARRTLAIAVVAGIGISVLLSFALASRALRPLRLIARTARSIRMGDVGRRIGYRRRDELGEVAAELDASFAELEGTLRRQERFVADASHELKTPLAAMRANLQLLQRWAANDPAAREEALGAVERSSARMARTIADLLHLARGEDRLAYGRERVRLDDLALAAVREARPLDPSVAVEIERLHELVIRGDHDRLAQLVGNLLDNAIGAAGPGGRVRLSVDRNGASARVTVADDGPGIPADELPRIFDRFYRGETSRRGGGSGLGLAIARSIARAHGGEIEVRTAAGEGSAFTLVLPV
jgi:two-component system, OmpR family, sensor kinase